MTSVPQQADFDTQPPVPVAEYEQVVKRVNVGYELLFTLTRCCLRALAQPALQLLVVGAGGGAELEEFLPANPGWQITGVDPSREMLALAQAKARRLGLQERVDLVRGSVDELPAEPRFDAATCMFVLHFLPDEGKLALLRGIARRLRPGAPLLVASGVRPDGGGFEEDLLGAWQQYGEAQGMPAERMAATIAQILAQPATPLAEYERLLRDAGFGRSTRLLSVLGGGITAWLAR
ncbi:MAG TPA: class I SAM-dependent methyltransferase [Dehalococcoidia bacterium]|nr:class I SAM-dependent methyltransferase [Dehalococcoidia bacterium]